MMISMMCLIMTTLTRFFCDEDNFDDKDNNRDNNINDEFDGDARTDDFLIAKLLIMTLILTC